MGTGDIYYDADVSMSILDERTVAILGYGNQGQMQAKNMRDSGVEVIVGNRSDEYRQQATEDGFEAFGIPEAAERGDTLFLLLPDEVAPDVFETDVKPHMEDGNLLNVASGYNLSYDMLRPPSNTDVTMVAPRMVGAIARRHYEEDTGFPSLFAVHRDATGTAKEVALAIAKAIGSTRAGAIEGTADIETKTDLLMEQAVFPIWISTMLSLHEILTEQEGIPGEIVVTELYLSGEIAGIFEDMAQEGLLGQLPNHSRTSQYGHLSRIDAFDRSGIESFIEEQLANIDNAGFAREWSTEQDLDLPGLKRLAERYENSDFIRDEQRAMEDLGLGQANESG
jgi:ketol-acid reductoisomerase